MAKWEQRETSFWEVCGRGVRFNYPSKVDGILQQNNGEREERERGKEEGKVREQLDVITGTATMPCQDCDTQYGSVSQGAHFILFKRTINKIQFFIKRLTWLRSRFCHRSKNIA